MLTPMPNAIDLALTTRQAQHEQDEAGRSRKPDLIACMVTGLTLSYLVVALRVYARRISLAGFGKDDILIVASLVALTAFPIAIFCGIGYGEGYHMRYVSNERGIIIVSLVCRLSYAISTVLTKSSVLCLYYRIFARYRLIYLSWAIFALTAMCNLALILVGAFQCIPLSSSWTDHPVRCINLRLADLILGVVNVIIDVGILAIPIRFVIPLQMDLSRKVQLCAIFLTGIIVCVFSIIRVTAIASLKGADISYNIAWGSITSFCEMFVGIIAASLPVLRILFTNSRFRSLTASLRESMSRSNTRRTSRTQEQVTDADAEPAMRECDIVTAPAAVQAVHKQPTFTDGPSRPEYQCLLDISIPSYHLHRLSANSELLSASAVRDYFV